MVISVDYIMWCVGRSHSGVEIVVVGLDLVVDGDHWLHGALAGTEGFRHVLNEPHGLGAWSFVGVVFLDPLSGLILTPVGICHLSNHLAAHLGDGELVSGHDLTRRSFGSRLSVFCCNLFDGHKALLNRCNVRLGILHRCTKHFSHFLLDSLHCSCPGLSDLTDIVGVDFDLHGGNQAQNGDCNKGKLHIRFFKQTKNYNILM